MQKWQNGTYLWKKYSLERSLKKINECLFAAFYWGSNIGARFELFNPRFDAQEGTVRMFNFEFLKLPCISMCYFPGIQSIFMHVRVYFVCVNSWSDKFCMNKLFCKSTRLFVCESKSQYLKLQWFYMCQFLKLQWFYICQFLIILSSVQSTYSYARVPESTV